MAKVTCESFAETCFFCRYLYAQQRWDPHEEMIHIFNGDGVVNVYSLNSLLRGLTSVGSWSAVIVDVTYAETGDIRITRNDGKEAGGQVVLLIDNDKKTYFCPSVTVTNYEITWEDFVDLFL